MARSRAFSPRADLPPAAAPREAIAAAAEGSAPRRRIVCIVGTRPEAIKLAPVVVALRRSQWARCRVWVSGQHGAVVDDALAHFGLAADRRLAGPRRGASLGEATAVMLSLIEGALRRSRPDLLIVQGDTSTVLAAALAACYAQVPLVHVEAGLRTGRLDRPFPEEAHRRLVAPLAALHLAPTADAARHLAREGIEPGRIVVTGSPALDAVRLSLAAAEPLALAVPPHERLLLVTAHRREHWGRPLRNICAAIARLVEHQRDLAVLWPLHPNPAVARTVHAQLGRTPRVHLTSPLPYGQLVAALVRAHLVLTDSGGLQEEAPFLGKPVLILREETERQATVEAGAGLVVGTDSDEIVAATRRLLADPDLYAQMSLALSPFGDGHAAERIVAAVARLCATSGLGATSRRRAVCGPSPKPPRRLVASGVEHYKPSPSRGTGSASADVVEPSG